MKLSGNKAGITKRKEPVAFFYSFVIGIEDIFPAGKCGHKHYQRAFGKMKISYQCIDAPEFVARIYENICPARAFFNAAVFIRKALECSA